MTLVQLMRGIFMLGECFILSYAVIRFGLFMLRIDDSTSIDDVVIQCLGATITWFGIIVALGSVIFILQYVGLIHWVR